MSATRLIVIGAGRVGLSLAIDLSDADRSRGITVVGRRPRRPEPLHARPDIDYVTSVSEESVPATEVSGQPPETALLFCVSDDRLETAAAAWAAAVPPDARIALHTSGLHPASALAPLAGHGLAVGSWHPIVALSRPRPGALRDITIGMDGDPEALALGRDLAETLGARVIRVDPGRTAAYHAAAVFGANHLVACLNIARRLLREASREATLADLLPLARSAIDNLERDGVERGATGPITRGDAGTVARHLDALDPGARAVYRALAMELLRLVEGRLEPAARIELERLLAGGTAPHVDPGRP